MELKVWVDGVVRVVCGLSEETSCQDVVIALAQAIGEWLPQNFPHCEMVTPLCHHHQTARAVVCHQSVFFFPCPLKCCLHNSPAEHIYCKHTEATPRRKAGVAAFSPLCFFFPPRPPFDSLLTQINYVPSYPPLPHPHFPWCLHGFGLRALRPFIPGPR